jgi:hypothetical protein
MQGLAGARRAGAREPGTVIAAGPTQFEIACGDDALEILEPSGQAAAAFLPANSARLGRRGGRTTCTPWLIRCVAAIQVAQVAPAAPPQSSSAARTNTPVPLALR